MKRLPCIKQYVPEQRLENYMYYDQQFNKHIFIISSALSFNILTV